MQRKRIKARKGSKSQNPEGITQLEEGDRRGEVNDRNPT